MSGIYTIDDAIYDLTLDLVTKEYYDTVLFEMVEEAVETAHRETGLPVTHENLEAYHEYISENLI